MMNRVELLVSSSCAAMITLLRLTNTKRVLRSIWNTSYSVVRHARRSHKGSEPCARSERSTKSALRTSRASIVRPLRRQPEKTQPSATMVAERPCLGLAGGCSITSALTEPSGMMELAQLDRDSAAPIAPDKCSRQSTEEAGAIDLLHRVSTWRGVVLCAFVMKEKASSAKSPTRRAEHTVL